MRIGKPWWIAVVSGILYLGVLGCSLSITINASLSDPTEEGTPILSTGISMMGRTGTLSPTSKATDKPRPSSTPMPSPSREPTPDCTHPFWSSSVPEGARARLERFIVWDLAVSPDGEYFAGVGLEGDWGSCREIVVLYRTSDLQEVWTHFSGGNMIEEIEFSPDGRYLAGAAHSGTVVLLSTATGDPENYFEDTLDEYVSDLGWSPDGSLLAVGISNASAVLWDVSTGKKYRTLGGNPSHTSKSHSEPCYLDWSPDGKRLAVGSDRGMIKVFDPVRDSMLLSFTAGVFPMDSDQIDWTGYFTSLAWSPDGMTLAAGSQYEIVLWNPQSGDIRRKLQGHPHTVTTVAWSPDGKKLASGDGYYNDDGIVIVWDATTGKMLKKLEGHHGFFVSAVEWTKDGTSVLAASIDGSLILWNAE